MATIQLTHSKNLVGAYSIIWVLGPSDDGEVFRYPKYADKTLHVFGDFGTGTVTLQGSNDERVLTDPLNAVWGTLTDFQGADLAVTANTLSVVAPNPRFIRPITNASIVSVSVTLECADA